MSVTLNACPICSNPPRLELPQWWVAQRTSERRKVRCAFLNGCNHVSTILGGQIVEAPDAPAAVARWNAEALRLFDAQTALWTDPQRAARRIALGLPAPA